MHVKQAATAVSSQNEGVILLLDLQEKLLCVILLSTRHFSKPASAYRAVQNRAAEYARRYHVVPVTFGTEYYLVCYRY